MEDGQPFPFRLEVLLKRYNQSGTLRTAGRQSFRSGKDADQNGRRLKKPGEQRNPKGIRQGSKYNSAADDLSNPEYDGGRREIAHPKRYWLGPPDADAQSI